ncbi:site-specific integrase [Streptomyces sp. H10-C2]|uniref:tyrosine-type recombinase/integrase n=1 Tax=unclassified Streptomyces TaxID=2593676 RepID=UPI0024BAA9F6|nr:MULTISPECIES: site-specific integrase [unclassified Streptomyces]MDJ0346757.1 site-specific integrase [Streptomyces sp. PH10-H1]MDJ0368920.1 site-specific integrase [Streptomyces sp. H10-C2]
MSLHHQLIEGRIDLPRIGSVVQLETQHPPYVVLDGARQLVEPAVPYLRDLSLSDSSPLTGKSYAYDLLRWFRILWFLDVPWDKAVEAEVAAIVGWLRTAPNPQRRRTDPASPPPGSVNPRTGKRYLQAGYQPSTINHVLTVVSSFYDFHQEQGRGPVLNPVPLSAARRRALAHRSPDETVQPFRRSRLRQRVSQGDPRAIPDAMWDEFFATMSHDRDRAAVLLYVSSGARASELLGVTPADINWQGQTVYVISKGTKLREPIPTSPQAMVVLAAYLDAAGLPPAHEPVFRTRRGPEKSLSYWAMRRVIQRVNAKLKTNWTLHDLRHTAAERMANDPHLTLVEVRAILRHSNLATTGRYLRARVEELFDALQAHYNRPRVQPTIAPGYDPDDFKAVFGG